MTYKSFSFWRFFDDKIRLLCICLINKCLECLIINRILFCQMRLIICLLWRNQFSSQIFLLFVSGFIRRFSGDKSNANFFKILGNDEKSLLIGARNVVYNVSLPNLEENIDQVRYFFDSLLNIIEHYGLFEV